MNVDISDSDGKKIREIAFSGTIRFAIAHIPLYIQP